MLDDDHNDSATPIPKASSDIGQSPRGPPREPSPAAQTGSAPDQYDSTVVKEDDSDDDDDGLWKMPMARYETITRSELITFLVLTNIPVTCAGEAPRVGWARLQLNSERPLKCLLFSADVIWNQSYVL